MKAPKPVPLQYPVTDPPPTNPFKSNVVFSHIVVSLPARTKGVAVNSLT